MSQVAIVKCPDYNQERVEKAVRETVDFIGGIRRFVKKGDKVLLKPNLLTQAKPEEAVTTHPTVLGAMIKLVYEAGGIPVVGDSPAFPSRGSLDKVAITTGIKDVVLALNAKLVDFSTPVEKNNPDGAICKKFIIAKPVTEVDCIISLPKLKTHGQTYFTGAIKNLFGCVPGLLKGQYHLKMTDRNNFSRMLVDLNILLKPNLAVMDSIVGMDGQGPGRAGNPKHIGVIIASSDLTALDAVATEIVGIEPFSILTTKIATERNFGTGRLRDIQILGNPVDEVRVSDFKSIKKVVPISQIEFLPIFIQEYIKNLFIPKPYVDPKRCTLCKTCIEVCPARPVALAVKNKRITINYHNCIRCYCCQELCPEGTIELKTGLLGKFLNR